MEYVEEEARPRFLVQSRSSPTSIPKPETLEFNKLHFAACLSTASLLLFSAVYFFQSQSQTLTFLLVWISLSLLIGPFAPSSFTGGDVRVGHGELLEPSDPDPPEQEESKKRIPGRRARSRRPEEFPSDPPVPVAGSVVSERTPVKISGDPICNGDGLAKDEREKEDMEEKEWNDEDFEILKKQILKHPVGEPRRWERVAEAFRGRHGVDSVIRMAKSMSERKHGDGDSFAQFLRQRKPLDKRADAVDGELSGQIGMEDRDLKENGAGTASWSSGEDIALLNALKAFPKDVSMRWEKITAAVPGKSKACCMKRVAELKRDFRSSKAPES